MQALSFVPINLHRCWPREWKQFGHVDIFFSNYHNLQSVYFELLFDANMSHEGAMKQC